MNYDDAMKATISRVEAMREVNKHDCEGWEQFLADCGDHASYAGSTILNWLGY